MNIYLVNPYTRVATESKIPSGHNISRCAIYDDVLYRCSAEDIFLYVRAYRTAFGFVNEVYVFRKIPEIHALKKKSSGRFLPKNIRLPHAFAVYLILFAKNLA